MDLWQLILLALIGCLTGFINVMAGGGSLLTMPVMVLMGMPGPVANGTNRVAILAQNITAVTGFFRQGFSDFKLSLSLSLCALPGALIGAYCGTKLQGLWFNRVLAGVMITVMVLMSVKKHRPGSVTTTGPPGQNRLIAAHILMAVAGFYGGFIQAGVGFILMAILHRVLGLDLVRVNMHKVFIVGTYTIFALAVFAVRGNVAWIPGISLAAGNAVGGWVGSHIAVKKGERLIRIVFNTALMILAIKLLLK
jgi:uncharacterized membrane protein YfcA